MPLSVTEGSVLGNAGNAWGGYPCTVHADFADAVEMRFGNTYGESLLNEWKPWEEFSTWWIRTGADDPTPRKVFAQIKDSLGVVTEHQCDVPPYGSGGSGTSDVDYGVTTYDPTAGRKNGETLPVVWYNDFASDNQQWCSYDYDGGEPGSGNWFYPASWRADGGPDGGPHIFTDDSRWRIDTPENPPSVLALMLHWWNGPGPPAWGSPWSFQNWAYCVVDLYVRVDTGFNAFGGYMYLWCLDNSGRWYRRKGSAAIVNRIPLNETWTNVRIPVGPYNTNWEQSFDSSLGVNPTLRRPQAIVQFGLGIIGFSQKPEGVLRLAKFKVDLDPRETMTNPNERYY